MLEKLLSKRIIDKEILSALFLISKNTTEGINYIEFVRQGNMFGATELINKGYAEKIDVSDILKYESSNYRLTKKGTDYLNKLSRFAYKKFK
jgi:hypothetical protein